MTPTGSDASMTFAVDIPLELVARAVAALAEAGVDLRPGPDLINYAPDAPDRPAAAPTCPTWSAQSTSFLPSGARRRSFLPSTIGGAWNGATKCSNSRSTSSPGTTTRSTPSSGNVVSSPGPTRPPTTRWSSPSARFTRRTLRLELPSRVFDTDQDDQAEDLARRSDSVVYTWKTAAGRNWLEQGLHRSDALGLTLLPPGLPREIDLADDQPAP